MKKKKKKEMIKHALVKGRKLTAYSYIITILTYSALIKFNHEHEIHGQIPSKHFIFDVFHYTQWPLS